MRLPPPFITSKGGSLTAPTTPGRREWMAWLLDSRVRGNDGRADHSGLRQTNARFLASLAVTVESLECRCCFAGNDTLDFEVYIKTTGEGLGDVSSIADRRGGNGCRLPDLGKITLWAGEKYRGYLTMPRTRVWEVMLSFDSFLTELSVFKSVTCGCRAAREERAGSPAHGVGSFRFRRVSAQTSIMRQGASRTSSNRPFIIS